MHDQRNQGQHHADQSTPLGYSGYTMYSTAQPKTFDKSPFQHSLRRRLNLVAIFASLFIPWLMFGLVLAMLSFQIHYDQPSIVYGVCGLTLVVTLLCGVYVCYLRCFKFPNADREPSWVVFMFVSLAIAWIAAMAWGSSIYSQYVQPYQQMEHLNAYKDVDPNTMRGQQLMDAGKISFVNGTRLNEDFTMSFKKTTQYCVVPITLGNEPLETYDFWAVGTNCCNATDADFHCEGAHNPHADGALRLMSSTRAYYRLAVQQAEATYNIRAYHPLFFKWIEDPDAEVDGWLTSAYDSFMIGIFSHLVFQAFLVTVAALAFSKIGSL